MRCVASITPNMFVSGAEEKVLRVFAAPGTFVETMNRLCGGSFVSDASHAPLGATVPVLGLSNKVRPPAFIILAFNVISHLIGCI